MNDDLYKYIKNEKDISRYKISLLNKGTKKNYKYRLMSIEKDFSEYPFEKIDFKDLEETKVALSMFKIDRGQFEKKFAKDIFYKTKIVSQQQVEVLNKKIKYYDDLYKSLLDFKIKEINLLQSEYVKSKLKKKTKDILSAGPDSLAEIEGVSLAKKRARIQILIYCISRFIYHKLQDLNYLNNLDEASFDAYDEVRRSIDNLFVDVKHNLFKHYNDGIKEVPLLINGTLGHNNFVNTIYPLINLMDKHPGKYCIQRVLSKDKTFFKKNKSPINKKFIKRGFAVVTPMRRAGNESIALLYMNLWTDQGVLIDDIMEKDFFNHSVNSDYFKAVATKPVWTFDKNINNKFLLREALGLLSLEDTPLVDKINFDDSSILNKINKTNNGVISICSKTSKMFIAATRSESEHIKEAYDWANLLIKQIKDDYKSLFTPTILEDKEREERRAKVEEFER